MKFGLIRSGAPLLMAVSLVACSKEQPVARVDGASPAPSPVPVFPGAAPVTQSQRGAISDGVAHRMRNVAFQTMLRPRGASSRIGTPLVLHEERDWKCLTWTFRGDDREGYSLHNHYTDRSFRPEQSEAENRLEQVDTSDAARWKPVENGDDTWRIQVGESDLVVTAMGKTAPVMLMPWKGDSTQRWLLESPGKN